MLRAISIAAAGALLMTSALAATAASRAPGSRSVQANPASDLLTVAQADGHFNTFVTLVKEAGLEGRLKEPGPYTVFAPTDKAWAQLPGARLKTLQRPEFRNDLAQLLLYHIIPGEVTSDRFSGTQVVATLEGTDLTIRASMDEVVVGTANIVEPDLRASNGIIHGIDSVLEIPEYPTTPVATK